LRLVSSSFLLVLIFFWVFFEKVFSAWPLTLHLLLALFLVFFYFRAKLLYYYRFNTFYVGLKSVNFL
ncbi:hypothetical protein DRJ00_06410, partial [Candidatus Aerophobetes bacterium]